MIPGQSSVQLTYGWIFASRHNKRYGFAWTFKV